MKQLTLDDFRTAYLVLTTLRHPNTLPAADWVHLDQAAKIVAEHIVQLEPR